MLLQYANKLSDVYRELDYDMNLLVKQHNGILRIGGQHYCCAIHHPAGFSEVP